jgi:hypothetical protein
MRGHETFGFSLFLVDMLRKYQAYVADGAALPLAGEQLIRIADIVSANPVLVDLISRQQMMDAWIRFRSIMRSIGADDAIPKSHAMVHLIRDSAKHGSPAFSACWLDEDLNSKLKHTLRLVHPSTFERMAFAKFARVLRKWSGKRSSDVLW